MRCKPLELKDKVAAHDVLQAYCGLDFNLRLTLGMRGHWDPRIKAKPLDMKEAHVLQKGEEFLMSLPLEERDRGNVVYAFKVVKEHRKIRHNFAHMAAKRSPIGDAIVWFSWNRQEAKRSYGARAPKEGLNWEVIASRDLQIYSDAVHRAGHMIAHVCEKFINERAKLNAS